MFVEHFDPKFQSQARIDTALLWLGLPRANRPELITVYLSPVDLAGHYHGPDSEEVCAWALFFFPLFPEPTRHVLSTSRWENQLYLGDPNRVLVQYELACCLEL